MGEDRSWLDMMFSRFSDGEGGSVVMVGLVFGGNPSGSEPQERCIIGNSLLGLGIGW